MLSYRTHRLSRVAAFVVAAALTPSVYAGPATHYALSTVSPIPFNTAVSLTLTALDSSEAVDTTYAGTAVLSSGDPGFVNLGPVTFANGAATINYAMKTAGTQTITATDTVDSAITGTTSVLVMPGPTSHLVLSAPANVTAGVPFSFTVSAQDFYGNVTPAYAGTVHFTSSDGAAVLPADSTLTNGVGTFSATFNSKPSESLTATDTANAGITGTVPTIFTPVRLQDFTVY